MEHQHKQFRLTHDLYASQSDRFINFVVDYVAQLLVLLLLGLIIGLIAGITGNNEMAFMFDSMSRIEEYLLGMVILFVYYSFFEILTGRTIGKFLTKTVTVTENGEKPETQTLLLRTLCRMIPFDALTFLGNSGRGWHDTLSKTYVVKKELLEKRKELFYSFDEIGNSELI